MWSCGVLSTPVLVLDNMERHPSPLHCVWSTCSRRDSPKPPTTGSIVLVLECDIIVPVVDSSLSDADRCLKRLMVMGHGVMVHDGVIWSVAHLREEGCAYTYTLTSFRDPTTPISQTPGPTLFVMHTEAYCVRRRTTTRKLLSSNNHKVL